MYNKANFSTDDQAVIEDAIQEGFVAVPVGQTKCFLYDQYNDVVCSMQGDENDLWRYAIDACLLPGTDYNPSALIVSDLAAGYVVPAVRRTPDHNELFVLVSDLVTQYVAGQATFTAYSITQHLRTENSDIEIVHDDVRDLVVSAMHQYNDYGSEDRFWQGRTARTWFYDPRLTAAQIAAILPATDLHIPAPAVNPILQLKSGLDSIDWDL